MNSFPIGMLTPEEAAPLIEASKATGTFVEREPYDWWDQSKPDESRRLVRFQKEYLFDTLANAFTLERSDYTQKSEENPPMRICDVLFLNALPVSLPMDGKFHGDRGKHGEEVGSPVTGGGERFDGLPGGIDGYLSFAVWQVWNKGAGENFKLRFKPVEFRFPYAVTVEIVVPHGGHRAELSVSIRDTSGKVIAENVREYGDGSRAWGDSASVRWQGTVKGQPASLALHANLESSNYSRTFAVVAALIKE